MSLGGRPSGATLAVLATAAAAAYLVAFWLDLSTLRHLAKPVPALLLAAWTARAGTRAIGRGVAAGLLLSAAGDVLLDFGRFVPGLLAFLAAHAAYAAAFTLARPRLLPWRALPFAVYGAAVLLVLRGGLGPMALPVGVYVVVICTMMWRAAARLGDPAAPALGPSLGLAGALAFAASDTLIAFDRFHAAIAGASLPVMLLYWLGQWGIAASAATAGAARPRAVSCAPQVSTP